MGLSVVASMNLIPGMENAINGSLVRELSTERRHQQETLTDTAPWRSTRVRMGALAQEWQLYIDRPVKGRLSWKQNSENKR